MFNHKVVFFYLVALLVVPDISRAADNVDAATSAAVAAIVSSTAPPPDQQAKPSAKISQEAAEISAINQRIAVMAARLAELEMQAKIKAKESELAKGMSADSGVPRIEDNVIPSVSEISGIDNKIWAVVNVRGGTQTVRVGDVAAGWRVTNIKSDSVTVEKMGRKLILSFGNNLVQMPANNDAPGAIATPHPMGGIPGYPGR